MQVVGTLHMEAQYCPFAATGEAAHPDADKKKQKGGAKGKEEPEQQRNVVRRMTRSNISNLHKGVLTVTLIGASGLTVRAHALRRSLPPPYLASILGCMHKGVLTVTLTGASGLTVRALRRSLPPSFHLP
jgi:hypothetical protein